MVRTPSTFYVISCSPKPLRARAELDLSISASLDPCSTLCLDFRLTFLQRLDNPATGNSGRVDIFKDSIPPSSLHLALDAPLCSDSLGSRIAKITPAL